MPAAGAAETLDITRRVKESFEKQGAMSTIGATLALVEPGAVDICLDWSQALTQQHGFLHAGMVSTALDSACGYAGLTLMPEGAAVLTIEFKINLLAPAKGQHFRMEGRVIKLGRTITVTEGKAFAMDEGKEKLIATMSCTLMCLQDRAGLNN